MVGLSNLRATAAQCALWGALVLGLVQRADSAVIVVDDFLTSQSAASPAMNVGPFGPLSNTVSGGGIVGGWRTLALSGFTFNQLQSVSTAVGGGFVDYQSGAGSTGMGSLTYNGNGAGLGGALAGTISFDVTLLFFNPGLNPSTISLAVSDNLNTVVETSGLLNSMTMTPVTLSFNFGLSGLNFNNITKVVLSLNNGSANGADMTLQRFVAIQRDGIPGVPEPSSLVAMSGLLGLALAVRRGRQWFNV